ncbi:hybrid sensor histidine kinase/response regulator transcription factor [Alkaliflexus imshenetskii]|uniref:hybrid sensor histidine kinase/response regulator transcription factor n=1 Tax=Alkaliflexus imshenetskii TaxID=286730 RepID=UPI000479AB99|nr:two-component regulator propeller domain-containing protein [Alkaliflexus imshenetskii]
MIGQHITHLGTEEGLNGRHAFNFQQDKKGFMWISTRFGVDRYDGSRVKNYPLKVIDEVGYSVRMFRVAMSRDSVLWAYSDRGTLYRYNESRDEFEQYVELNIYLRALHFDTNNQIWIGSKSLFGYVDGDSLRIIDMPRLRGLEIKSISDFDDEKLLIATNQDVLVYNLNEESLIPIVDNRLMDASGQINIESIYYNSLLKQLWIGTIEAGVFFYDVKSEKLSLIDNPQMRFNPILTILPISDYLLFVGTDGAGAWLIDQKQLRVVRTFQQREGLDFTLSGDGVYDIYRDKEERVWISTYSDGVNILDFGRQGFQILRHEKNNDNSLGRDHVSGMLEDSRGRIWFATNDGVSIYSPADSKWQHLLNRANALTIYEDSRRNIWVGTYALGVYKLDLNGRILKHYMRQAGLPGEIGSNFIYTIIEDCNGDIWMGGKKGRISKYYVKDDVFTHISLSQANYFLRRKPGELLFACESGVYALDVLTGDYAQTKFSTNLKSRYVCDVYFESDSIIWLATYGDGLNRCNYYTGEVVSFTSKTGLNSDFVYSILPDDRGGLWFSSENGIGKIELDTYAITHITIGDGISDTRFRQLSRMKSRSGKIYFGSYNGVTYFHPDKISLQETSARIVLTEFSLFNQKFRPGDKNTPLHRALDDTKQITLKHYQHSFTLNFVTINFDPGGNRRHLWKLEGLDEYWIGPTSDNVVNYTNLAPKEYILRIKSIGDNNRVLDERVLKIVVKPPIWQAVPARLVFALLMILLLYWVYLYVRHFIEKRHSEEKIRFFINTTHDIRTPLTLISSPLYELKENLYKTERNAYLFDLITSNLEKLNLMFSQLLDFQKVYESREQLVVRERNVNNYLKDRLMYWMPLADKKNQKLTLVLPDSIVREWFDSEKMDKILDNLVFNSIKYTPEGGSIQVQLTVEEACWQLSVSDNGIGIPKQERKSLFKRFYRAKNAINSQETGSGLGLMLVKTYVELHSGSIAFHSEENKGAEFYIRFKHGSKHFENSIMLDNSRLPINKEEFNSQIDEEYKHIRKKVLVVEDNKDLRAYLKLSLGHYFKVYDAENGHEAWEQLQVVNPDIVVSDLQMPEMNGFELCRNIKTTFETSHIPVILLTVMADEKNMEEGLKTGADDYMAKPFDVRFLKIKIDNILNNRNLVRKKYLDVDVISPSQDDLDNQLNREFIEKAIKIIDARLTESKFSITDFSKEMGLSRSLLYNKFQSITGYTPNDFIRITRLKKAVLILREKKYSINEIAVMTGFNDSGYFATCFKKVYGKSPKNFIDEEMQ